MLNIIFLGRPPFPNGPAMSKRHKYIIDFLCTQPNITIHKYCSWSDEKWNNSAEGFYNGKVHYVNTQYSRSIKSVFEISKECVRFLRNAYRQDSDNVIVTTTMFPFEQIHPLLEAKNMGYKVVVDAVENYESKGTDASFLMKLQLLIAKYFYKRKIDGVFAISSMLADIFKARVKVPILELPNSTPINYRGNKRCFGKPFKVVYTGTFASKDGVEYLISGFNSFSKMPGVDAKLILVGGGEKSLLLREQLKNNEKIHFAGFVPDTVLNNYLHDADVLCMTRCNSPFANYGFPFKLSEYLATGNPVLATSVSDVPKYLKDGVNAFLIPPDNSNSIADKLLYIYTHEQESLEIGKRGIDVVNAYFDITKNGKKFLDFIIQVCKS